MTVFDAQLINGTIATRSLVNANAAPMKFVGTLQLQAADLADASLSIELTLQYSIEPGVWHRGAIYDWQGGPNAGAPKVEFDGLARRVRLSIDPSRAVTVGVDLVSQS